MGAEGTAKGYAKIYDWSGGSWSQYDQTITGQSPRRLGWAVAISPNGEKVFTGAPNSNEGYVEAYAKGFWQYNWDVDAGGTPADGNIPQPFQEPISQEMYTQEPIALHLPWTTLFQQ